MSTSNNPVDNWTNYDPIAFPSKDVRQFHKPPAIFQGDDMIVTDTNVLVLLEAKVIKTSTKSLDGDDEDVISESYTTSVVHLKKDSASDISKIRNKVGLITDQQTKYFKCTKCSDSFDDKKLKYQCKFCKDVICGSCSLGVLESQYELEQFERYGYRVCKSCGPHPKLQDYLAAEQGKLDSHLNAMKVFAEQEEAARNTRMKEDQAKYDATMKCYSHTAFRRPPGKLNTI